MKQNKSLTISSRFNRFVPILLAQLCFACGAFGQIPPLSGPQLDWLGERIFENECNRRFDCLTSWNSGEAFPSFGIGHFIWYRADQDQPFEETFPSLLTFYDQQGIALPAWLDAAGGRDSPWHSRQQFYAEFDGSGLTSLRRFLADTRAVQVRFIVRRLETALTEIVQQFPPPRQTRIETRLTQLARTSPPLGLYALIDYVHFKGTGLKETERYQGEGWGLIQVMEAMEDREVSLENFVAAATAVLERRVRNAPDQRDEGRWLPGWKNRLKTYLPGP